MGKRLQQHVVKRDRKYIKYSAQQNGSHARMFPHAQLTVSDPSPNPNKPGTAQVGAISKAQKDSKTIFFTGDNKSSQKTKH